MRFAQFILWLWLNFFPPIYESFSHYFFKYFFSSSLSSSSGMLAFLLLSQRSWDSVYFFNVNWINSIDLRFTDSVLLISTLLLIPHSYLQNLVIDFFQFSNFHFLLSLSPFLFLPVPPSLPLLTFISLLRFFYFFHWVSGIFVILMIDSCFKIPIRPFQYLIHLNVGVCLFFIQVVIVLGIGMMRDLQL